MPVNDLAHAQIRFATYYATILSNADDLFCDGQSTNAGLKLFTEELTNIKLGQQHAQANAGVDAAFDVLCRDYPMHGANLLNLTFHPNELVRWGESALISTRRLADKQSEAVILSNLGMAYQDLGELSRALECQKEALSIAR